MRLVCTASWGRCVNVRGVILPGILVHIKKRIKKKSTVLENKTKKKKIDSVALRKDAKLRFQLHSSEISSPSWLAYK